MVMLDPLYTYWSLKLIVVTKPPFDFVKINITFSFWNGFKVISIWTRYLKNDLISGFTKDAFS